MEQRFVDAYINWLSQDIIAMNQGDCKLFTTPFINPVNDCNQVSITYANDRIRISDEATTHREIVQDDQVNIEKSPTKKTLLTSLLEMYCMELEGSEFVRYCTEKEFPWALHYFSIGIIAIQNTFAHVKNQNYASSLESSDSYQWKVYKHVESGFISRKISFRSSVKKMGVSGFHHKYDFTFGKNEEQPVILMKTPNELKPDNTQLMMFEWEDYLKTTPDNDSLLFVVANDTQKKIDPKIINLVKTGNNTVYCPLSDEDTWMEACRRVQ